VIHLAHTEVKSTARGVGLVKLMGRNSGFIACMATRASQEADFVLIPESPFALHGENGFLSALERRIDDRVHAVVVVAEGAGQDLFQADGHPTVDGSGNIKLHDIGPRLRQEILDHFVARGRPVDLKYIDPSYTIRSVPPSTADSLLCDELARRAVHAAMSGRTDMMISTLNGAFVHVPIAMACVSRRQVDLDSDLWSAVLAATGQPPRFTAQPSQ
jgi:6-phosphofructokinase 1